LLATSSSDLSTEVSQRLESLSQRIRAKIGDRISITDSGQSEIRSLLGRAINERASVRIHYYSPQSDEIKERTITPFDFIVDGAFEYVRAFCELAEGVRTFRIDRISDFSKELIAGSRTQSQTSHKEPISSSVRIVRGDRSTAESLGLAPNEVLVGGSISLSVFSLDWLTRAVLASRGDLVIEEPSQVRRSIVHSLDSTLALYEEGAITLAPTIRT
jgi:proteasome accessory factor C